MSEITDPETLLEGLFDTLRQAATTPGAVMRTAVLANLVDHQPSARHVVLRYFDAAHRLLACHTDIRSAKVSGLHASSRVQWLFFNPGDSVQLRLSGPATLERDGPLWDRLWAEATPAARTGYLVEPGPGTALATRTTGLPDTLWSRDASDKEATAGRVNFAALVCKFDALDWLELGRYGHGRAQFRWDDENLTASWVVP